MTKPYKLADIEHDRGDMWAKHRPSYSDMCPVCGPRLERTSRITRLLIALRGFGYTTLAREEVEAAYDAALAGTSDPAEVIHLLVRSQLADAGIIAATAAEGDA